MWWAAPLGEHQAEGHAHGHEEAQRHPVHVAATGAVTWMVLLAVAALIALPVAFVEPRRWPRVVVES